MTAQIVDLASYRAVKKRAECDASWDNPTILYAPVEPRLPYIGAHADDEFTRDNRVDLRKLFQEE